MNHEWVAISPMVGYIKQFTSSYKKHFSTNTNAFPLSEYRGSEITLRSQINGGPNKQGG